MSGLGLGLEKLVQCLLRRIYNIYLLILVKTVNNEIDEINAHL